MKLLPKVLWVVLLIMFCSVAVLSQTKVMKSEDQKELTWDEAKEDFHHVMAATFHPAEEGDLIPLKEKYNELIQASKVWSTIVVPEDLDGNKLGKLIEQLYVDSSGLGEMVAKGTADKELKAAIFKLHDVFHEIVGLCSH